MSMAELQTQTALLEAPRRFDIVMRPKPSAAPGEVVVRIAATAVCGTDLEIYTGRHPGVNYPVVLGHEATGIVDSVGEGVTRVKAGDAVLINPIIACGRCKPCLHGRENLCRNAGLFGREVEGSMSQFVMLKERYVHVLPDGLGLTEATLIETLATVRHAQSRAGLTAGESVVVLGQGTSGLLHTALAGLSGSELIIAVSRSTWKLDMAQRLGAHHVIGASAADAVAEVLSLTGGEGADLVIDTAGGETTLMAGIEMLRPGGRLSAFAVSHESPADFSTFPLYYKEVNIIGSRALLPEDMDPSIALFATGQIDVSGFITETYPLDQAAAAFEEFERNPGRILRIVIDSNP